MSSWCPLLPRRTRLTTVFGKPIVLPKIDEPTGEDLEKWHAVYIKELRDLFDRHKAKY
ncbi:unnamed protein product, partial [Choristocarpus tenellus]